MKIELHILQNFAPSCLNRDDTGSPKDCEFGGYRRARISSQCYKRAIRTFIEGRDFPEQDLGIRTRLLVEEIARGLARRRSCDHSEALAAAERGLSAAKLGTKPGKGHDDDRRLLTEYALYIPRRIVEQAVELFDRHWDDIFAAISSHQEEEVGAAQGKRKSKRKAKRDKEKSLPSELASRVKDLISGTTPDIALFGRMIADNTKFNVDAAVQVAHAVSTHRMTMEFDFYTAVDDLQPREEVGAAMMGTVQFTSACMYRFALLDVEQLRRNLTEGSLPPESEEVNDLVRKSCAAFLRASVEAIPTGKQTAMAAHNLPSFVLAIVRERGPTFSLANAFLDPVRPADGIDLIGKSAQALDKHLGNVARMYGVDGISAVTWCTLEPTVGNQLLHLAGKDNSPLDAVRPLVQRTDSVASLLDLVVASGCGVRE